jgi:hypothetical protein
MEQEITQNFEKYEINILSYNCGKQVKKEEIKDIILKHNCVIYKDGFYCCPLKCRRSDE